MNIIFSEHPYIEQLNQRYLLLSLDRIRTTPNGSYHQAWCVISNDEININEIGHIDHLKKLHEEMMNQYRLKNWKFCQDAIEQLLGKFNGKIDSFYNEILSRVENFKKNDPGPNWDSVLDKSSIN
jgi:hypothetical protein